ncbi:MAG: bifunctional dihydroorotate dehydrogenase B NAD binding subunit/NADPH-dependent glutamate synthase [Bacteroidales bacterium]
MFEIIEKKHLAPDIYSMKVKAPAVANSAKPGQFVIVIADSKSERIPLTISDFDAKEGTVDIVIQAIGYSTRKLVKLQKGDFIHDFVGPLGTESEFIHQLDSELSRLKILFIAGGVGAAPVYPQAKWLYNNGYKADVIIGARSKELIIFKDEFRPIVNNLYITTDDGSDGFHGNGTQLLEKLTQEGNKYDLVVSIGPMIMMKFVAETTRRLGIKTIVSLNSLMIDGTGMCGACRVTVGGKIKFTCVDGPEFDAHAVDFDEAMRRLRLFKKEEKSENEKDHECNLDKAVQASNGNKNNRRSRVPVREQDPEVRNKNFDEVCLGYNEEEAVSEAQRCLECKKPLCVTGCPVNVKIPNFIKAIKDRNFATAASIISEDSALPAICGRVCPQEIQCEGKCILGIKGEPVAIGKLERFVADWARDNNVEPKISSKPKNGKIAVIGSGPAGLTCAGDLAKMGYNVTIFEALQKPGGVLEYGIPEFRLPKDKVVKAEIKNLEKLGVKIITNYVIGKTNDIDVLLEKEGFDAAFIGSGAGLPKFMGIQGENLNGVFSANEFLTRNNLMKAYRNDYDTPITIAKHVAIVGGGNVAMDAARVAKRLGSRVTIVYRRSEEELPARAEEVIHAKEEGIEFLTLTNPIEILGNENGWVKGMRCIQMKLGLSDDSGRRTTTPIPNSEFLLMVDEVIMALGTIPNPIINNSSIKLKVNSRKCIEADEKTGATSHEGIFAGGDAVTGAATVILAMGAGKKAALAIDEYITKKKVAINQNIVNS